MAAKLLHSLTEDNPDLQRQIGCMTGIFQLFDRQPLLTSRRITGHNPKRLPPGSSRPGSCTFDKETDNIYQRPAATEKHSAKIVLEKQRLSTESSRASFSSSSRSSSFSSLDCNRMVQPEPLSFDRIIFPETPSRDRAVSQSNMSPQFSRQNLDLRDVVKESMNRETLGLTAKATVKDEPADYTARHRDSPRPAQPSMIYDGTYGMGGPTGKKNFPADLKESLRVLAKLQEAPWYFNEPRELSRSASYHSKDGSLYSLSKDAPRFSYDGRELHHLSSESRETLRTAQRLKELPRLSLDSREAPMRGLNSELKSNFSSKLVQKESGNSALRVANPQRLTGTQSRPPSVVAKLMGLEALPDSASATDSKTSFSQTRPVEDSISFSRSSELIDRSISTRKANFSKSSWNEPNSPRWRTPDSAMKPISRFPLEPAPWRQFDKTRASNKPVSRNLNALVKTPDQFPSVYSEIEKRLKDLEFAQSGRDLRALKQILEAMQAKGLLENHKEGQDSKFTKQKDIENKYNSPMQNVRSVNQRRLQNDQGNSLAKRGPNSSRNFESPIVIMKPAKLIEKSGIPASSVASLDGLSTLPRPQGADITDSRKVRSHGVIAKDQTPKISGRNNTVGSIDAKTNSRISKLAQASIRSQQLPKENTSGSVKTSGSISPRTQQKRLELEKRSRPPTPPSDSTRSRRQSNKQQGESSSPGGKRRLKYSNSQQSDDQLSEISSESRNMSYHESDISVHFNGNVIFDTNVDMEVTSSEQSPGIIRQSHSMKAAKNMEYFTPALEQKVNLMPSEDESLAEVAIVAPEYPSPVSVLDNSVHVADSPSPVKHVFKNLEDDRYQGQGNPGEHLMSDAAGRGLPSEINRKKLQNIENLVQKLRRLNSSHDEARTDYIASLCENTNPDHRYISEILLASGLLLRDLGSNLTAFQFHSSGYPINPELFLVLEQTRASNLVKEEYGGEKALHMNPKEKFLRKLIFDVVNEILAGKLAPVQPSLEPWLKPCTLAKNNLNAQKLLRELCLEIEQLQAKTSKYNSLEDEDDDLKSILLEDVMHRSESWTDFNGEVASVVLDVERRIFKDLVDEIVIGDVSGLRSKPARCRQLFVK